MNGVAKIFIKELQELLTRPYLALWLIIIPLCFLYVAGNSNDSSPRIRTLVQPSEQAYPTGETVQKLVSEYSNIDLLQWQSNWSPSPVGLVQSRSKIGVFWQDGWRVVVRPSNDEERIVLLELARRIALSIGFKMPLEAMLLSSAVEQPEIQVQVLDFGTNPAPGDAYLVPRMIALITIFIPFLMAVSTIARDKENGTIGVLLIAPNVGWRNLIIGKTLTCLFVAVISLLLLIIAAVAIFNMSVQSGFPGGFRGMGLQLLAIMVSTLQGLAASALVRSQFQAYLVSTVYAFCLVFLTGLLFPLEQATETVRFASLFFPLTFSREPLEEALLLGLPAWPYVRETGWLAGQLTVAAVLAIGSLSVARSRL
ncbi:MAG: ABC transporter permease [gamma proteobacterium symbiont of Bathyaustriella thionipta]|nr:ABC transporter permease [gamma proteobacterium symbiont of Bathyaustriella thionipta]MCU7951085.1 ABC transporter permease [gamma proteobacterium symbiont of Bathyaustriella thionipta]MCU7952020.1 ABC transporter permease [gamma proteobacterium symbiont of Bathyaustriella thionipta]MCU7957585.1 ABC transporter permease [gamma proteobacterium symbiont of Bathyaustriella thionipta]MCU7966082.1 ABC transporter permease [gamma proteobacterium symbiont of Bathyaustriella thionipta]